MNTTRRALLSVSNKDGLVPFASRLAQLGYQLISTGGTFRTLRDAGLAVTPVSEVTGHPEVFGGRVKTLHPAVHGGILFRRDLDDHRDEARDHGVVPIDLVVVNLYPFEQTVAHPDATWDLAIENIDIGGPAMVRAAAKNHASVLVLVDPAQYERVASALEADVVDSALRRELALHAFRHTAAYDAAIARWMSDLDAPPSPEGHRIDVIVPDRILRYGENPHQRATLARRSHEPSLGGARILQGREVSYNNLVDLDAAVSLVQEFTEPACVIVKHTNPCGVGRHPSSLQHAWESALAADPVSAFGGIVAVNQTLEAPLARAIAELFLEVVAAPSFTDDAVEILATRKNLRLVEVPRDLTEPRLALRSTRFGLLQQESDPRISELGEDAWRIVTKRAPEDHEIDALRFLERVCKHVKSNAIVLGFSHQTIGIGAGQMSRVDSVELAVRKAKGDLAGASLASDAFFPFRDGVDAAAAAGVRAILQPGGSRRDDEVIAACDEHGIAMILTGFRHFRH